MEWLAPIEGEWSDDPADLGGQTKWGVSRLFHPDVWPEIHSLTDATRLVYWPRFWLALGCDTFPPALGVVVFDWAVNSGPGAARRYLQPGIDVWEYLEARVRFLANGTQHARFTTAGVDKTHFLEGHWVRTLRLAHLVADLDLAPEVDRVPEVENEPPTASLPTQETQTMPVFATEPKPLVYSRRVWAALLGLLPTLVTLMAGFGWNVPLPDGLVAGLDGAVQALFGLVVAGLALWSKVRPDSPK